MPLLDAEEQKVHSQRVAVDRYVRARENLVDNLAVLRRPAAALLDEALDDEPSTDSISRWSQAGA